MKTSLRAICVILSGWALFSTTNAFASDKLPGIWFSSIDSAMTVAQKEHKVVMLYFSGSDWCKPCIRLSREIIESAAFTNFAKEHLAMMHLDFPKMKKNRLSPNEQLRNEALAERFNRNGVFPLLVFIDGQKEVLGTLSYQEVTPEAFIQKIEEIIHP